MQPTPPVNYGVILFPGFQALDVFGTLDVLNILSTSRHLNLYILAASLDPISTKHNMSGCPSSDFGESVVPTHTFTDPPVDLEVLLIPGGRGTRDEEAMKPVVDFVRDTYSKLSYLLTVCTGSAVLARTGILDRRRATSNKKSWAWMTAQGPKVEWVPKARWVVDGNIWTSSGITAGMDLIYAFVEHVYGGEVAEDIANASEYERHVDPNDDPFAGIWKAGA